MLVLSRQLGESIRVGNDITITVLQSRGKYIRIGISAPDDIPVHRKEVHRRNQRAKLAHPTSVE